MSDGTLIVTRGQLKGGYFVLNESLPNDEKFLNVPFEVIRELDDGNVVVLDPHHDR